MRSYALVYEDDAAMIKKTELLKNVDPKWHKELLVFVETGEATEEFMKNLDQDKACQEAVELAFDHHAAEFDSTVEELRRVEGD